MQQLFRTEQDARHPRFGQMVAQAVGIEHSEQNAQNERAERETACRLRVGQIERCAREKCDEQDAVEDVSVFFREHSLSCMSSTLRFGPPAGSVEEEMRRTPVPTFCLRRISSRRSCAVVFRRGGFRPERISSPLFCGKAAQRYDIRRRNGAIFRTNVKKVYIN